MCRISRRIDLRHCPSCGEARHTTMPKLNLFERINRATYWVWLIPLIVVVVAIAVINVFIAMSAPGLSIRGAEWLFLLAFVPRLHDVGRSGWWGAGVIFGNEITSELTLHRLVPMTVGSAVIWLTVALAVYLGAQSGRGTSNIFGDPPPAGVANIFRRHRRPDPGFTGTDYSQSRGILGLPATWVIVSGRVNRATFWAWLMGQGRFCSTWPGTAFLEQPNNTSSFWRSRLSSAYRDSATSGAQDGGCWDWWERRHPHSSLSPLFGPSIGCRSAWSRGPALSSCSRLS
jgi:uncharacterized membrane protein YhaH (DUF805 family)